MSPDVSGGVHDYLVAGVFDNQHVFHTGGGFYGLVHYFFKGQYLAAAVASAGGHNHFRAGIIYPVCNRLGRKAGEDYVMDCTDPVAGQQDIYHFGYHGQVDSYPVSLAYAQLFQDRRIAVYVFIKVRIAYGLGISVFAFPVYGHLAFAPAFGMAVYALVRHIQLAAYKPAGIRRIPVQYFFPWFFP
ncbi:MAG: hypothetical protein EGMGGAKC_00989 [Dehalococcoides mccartyi]|nr:hypothetical protein [Dehalococcoides mccartyi]